MRALVSALVLVVAATPSLAAQSARAARSPALDSARAGLEKYQDIVAALRDGYLSTVMCMDFPSGGMAGETHFGAGAMGVHLLNGGLIGAPLDPAKPQVLIYEPRGDSLRLVAAEWFVPVQAATTPPQLFGRTFDGPMDGHPPIMPESLRHWDLHVWLWRENPAGVFSSTNSAVRCPNSAYTVKMGGH